MLTLTDLLDEYVDVTNDTSTANRNRGIRRINQYQRQICSMKNFWWLNKEYTITTIADQHNYQLPVFLRRPSSITVTVGSIDYPVEELPNGRAYDKLRGLDGTDYSSDYPTFYHIRNGQILLYPEPASANNTINIAGLAKPSDLQNEDYSTGTIAVTNGSTTVIGTTTVWSTNTKAGAYMFIDDVPYEVASVDSNTEITLYKAYEGVTASGLSYKVGDVSLVHEDYQDILWVKAAKFQLGLKKANTKTFQLLQSEEDRIMVDLLRNTNSATTQNVWSPMRKSYYHPNTHPENIG